MADTVISTETAQALVDRAKGNPFFIEELALAAQRGGDPAVELPASVQAVIGVRIGHLSPELRKIVYVMAVNGALVSPGLLAHILRHAPAQVESALRDLVALGFLQTDGFCYGFRHMLINDTAYAMIARRDRQRLHGEIARYLETEEREDPAGPEQLAWHFQQSGDKERAIPYWLAAGRAALHRSSQQEAIVFAENGLALIDEAGADSDRHELDLLLCLAPALTAVRGFGSEDVGAAYRRADALNRHVGTAKTEIRVRVGLWIHTWVRGQLTESLEHGDRLLELSGQLPDPALVLQANASVGQVLLHRGELHLALSHLEKGLAAIAGETPTTTQAQNAAVSCVAYAAWVARMLGRHEEAAQWLERSRTLCFLHDNAYADAIHHALGTESFMFDADAEGCREYADRAVAVSREHGFAFWLGTGLVMRGWALGQCGEFDAAFADIDEGIAVFEATGARVQLANWHGLRSETLLAAGRHVEALSAARHALDCAARAEDVYFTPRIHAVAAACAADRPQMASLAQTHRQAATRLARKFQMTDLVLSPGVTSA
jgi:tetratricopeptide (TPR) repeat protein